FWGSTWSRCGCIGWIDFCACWRRWPEYIQVSWHCDPNAARYARLAGLARLRGNKIPDPIQNRTKPSKESTPFRLDRILVTVGARPHLRGVIGICHVGACIQSCCSRRVRRCYLLGCRWIFALVARNPVGILLDACRPQNPRKTR